MVWQKNGTPLTLGSELDDMDITDLTAKKLNQFLIHKLGVSAENEHITFNNNGNSVYADRYSYNGTEVTNVTQAYLNTNFSNQLWDNFMTLLVCSITGEEKLCIGFKVYGDTAGAGTAPNRMEFTGKFVPSPDADITRIDINNTGGGGYTTGSNISALGTSGGEVNYKIQDGAVFEETDTNKHYLYSSTTGIWTLIT